MPGPQTPPSGPTNPSGPSNPTHPSGPKEFRPPRHDTLLNSILGGLWAAAAVASAVVDTLLGRTE